MLGYTKILNKLNDLDKRLDTIEQRNTLLDQTLEEIKHKINKSASASFSPNSSMLDKDSPKYTLVDDKHKYIGKFDTLQEMADALGLSVYKIYTHLDYATNIVDLSTKESLNTLKATRKAPINRIPIHVNLLSDSGVKLKEYNYASKTEAINDLNIAWGTLQKFFIGSNQANIPVANIPISMTSKKADSLFNLE